MNVVVPEAQNEKAAALQIGVAHLIAFAFRMLTSIRFNDQPLRERNEVDDPGSDRDLPAEFDGVQLPRAQEPPKLLLGIGESMAKTLRLTSFEWAHAILRHLPLTRRAARATLSHGGGGQKKIHANVPCRNQPGAAPRARSSGVMSR